MTNTISENSTTGNINAELVLIVGGDLSVEMMGECVNVIGGVPIVFNATSEEWPVLVHEGQCK